MEDNKHNELIENGIINSFLRSGSNRITTQSHSADLLIISSKTKLKKTNVNEKHFFESHSIEDSTASKKDEAGTFYSNCDLEDDFSSKGNGVSTTKIKQKMVSGNIANKISKHKHIDHFSDVVNSRRNSNRKSAFLFYKAAGDWWNVFPKTDYTYSKSSSCRKEIAPGIVTMPNLSRSPIRSSAGWKSAEMHSVRQNSSVNRSQSDDFSDEVNNDFSSSSTSTHIRRSILLRIYTVVQYIFSSLYSVLTLKKYRLGFESTPVSRRGDHFLERTRYHRLEIFCYRSAGYFLLLDSWLLSLFHGSRDKDYVLTDRLKHSKYLFLLLIPPLLLVGLWYNLMGTSASVASISSMSVMKHVLPFFSVQTTSSSDFAKYPDSFTEDGNMDLLVQKILSSSKFKNILLTQDFRNEHKVETETAFLSAVELEQEKLKEELNRENLLLVEQREKLMDQQITNERLSFENFAMRDQIEQLEMKIKTLQTQLLSVSRRIEDCRKRIIYTIPKIDIEHHVTSFLSELFGTSNESNGNSPENIKIWLKSLEAAKDNLEQRLEDTVTIMNEKIKEAMGKSAETIMVSVSEMMREEFKKKQDMEVHSVRTRIIPVTGEKITEDPCCECCLSSDQVKEIVNNAIHLYDADKTGMVDYALESGGGTVINIRCTENYNERSLVLAFLGVKFPWSSNHPRIALQPDVHPGNCWAFRGAQGYLVIKLSKRIQVSAFSIEHIAASISPAGNINTAPKNFSVMGLNDENDHNSVLLGKYMYDSSGPPLQIFPVQNENAPPFDIVELKIESNHGNLEYTCLYRFRVHGVAV